MPPKTFLLINPYLYDFSAYDLWLKPLGLLYLAAILEQQGCRVFLVDAMDRWHPGVLELQKLASPKSREFGIGNFYREIVPNPEIFQGIKRYYARYGVPPDMMRADIERVRAESTVDAILVTSGMTYWYRGVHEVVGLCKEIFPKIPVLLGGIYATLCADHARKYSAADFVIQGDGELPILDLLSRMGVRPIRSYEGHDDYPAPAYHLYPRLSYVAMMTSRGCPYHCSFCATHRFTPGFRPRRPEKVVEEIESYARREIADIAFYDDALFADAERHIKPILRRVIEKNLRVRFHTPNGLFARCLDEELSLLLARSGFKTIRLSYETKNPERQKQMGKVRDKDLENALGNLEKAGFNRRDIVVYLLMGLPHQLPQEVEESIRYVTGLGARVSLASYAPIPHTPEWEIAVKDYRFPPDDPLYSNKSVYPLRRDDFSYEDFEAMKNLAMDANRQLM